MKPIKFALLSDFHYDLVYDGMKRLNNVVTELNNEDFDFVISLGDFCHPVPENKCALEQLSQIKTPIYHTFGNHDVEHDSLEDILQFYGLERDYYSFSYEHALFIVLNTNYMLLNGEYKLYNQEEKKGNEVTFPYVPPVQIGWLKQELKKPYDTVFVLSHHSLENEFSNRGVINKQEIQEILSYAKQKKKTIVSLNGHDHSESRKIINNVHYFGMNSMNYIWLGTSQDHSLLEEHYEEFPILKKILMYQTPLYSFFNIQPDGSFEIKGSTTSYLTYDPVEIGVGDTWNGRKLSSAISDGSYKVL